MRKRIHVNQHNIRHNAKSDDKKPVFSVKTSRENTYGNDVRIVDENGNCVARFVYSPEKPLSCGAKVWVETELHVLID